MYTLPPIEWVAVMSGVLLKALKELLYVVPLRNILVVGELNVPLTVTDTKYHNPFVIDAGLTACIPPLLFEV
jgi:hypothetical protein